METTKFYTGARIRKLYRSRPSGSSSSLRRPKSIRLYDHDLTPQAYTLLSNESYIAVDTETGGLDYRNDALLLVQLCSEEGRVYMVRKPTPKSKYLIRLLREEKVGLIFHHALFDLRFLQAQLNAILLDISKPIFRIGCTKTLMKCIYPQYKSGLGSALKEILGVKINKVIDHGGWDQEVLNDEQIVYACNDVIYLHELMETVSLHQRNMQTMLTCSIATRAVCVLAELHVRGYTDLLDYPQDDYEEVKKNRDWWKEKQCS